MIDTPRGHVYAVAVRLSIDKYDVVPDLLRQLRHHLAFEKGWWDGEAVNVIFINTQAETDARLLQSRGYLDNRRRWFEPRPRAFTDVISVETDMELTGDERRRLQAVLGHPALQGNVLHQGWVDQHHMC